MTILPIISLSLFITEDIDVMSAEYTYTHTRLLIYATQRPELEAALGPTLEMDLRTTQRRQHDIKMLFSLAAAVHLLAIEPAAKNHHNMAQPQSTSSLRKYLIHKGQSAAER